ncbi:Tripartite motif-containing protein 44 [Sciurus carolinensis]|uniref:Tripartite motif-containing protein 44 n=1 Tax=Sciurus carolinensis TaxID=30640 RepID=A0AA41NA23_SCICA|nr:Tripartite motif-containing protein 44 [Sciurus carolinensis]
MAPGVGAASRVLPHNRKCEECAPEEAARAAEVCRECGSRYCGRHAEAHRRKFPGHHLAQCLPGARTRTSRAGGEGPRKEEVGASVEPQREAENETEDSESEEESETEQESEDESEESEEDSEEEPESETDEDDHEGEAVVEGEPAAEGEFDREAEMKAKSASERKTCPDHGPDLSTHCQKDGPLICVLGAHQDYQLYTPDEALEELINKDSSRTKEALIELVEKLKVQSADPKVTRDQMKVFLQEEFKKVQKVVADEEQKAVHLVDILNVMDTAHLPEILADIQSRVDRQTTQTAQAKEELNTANESAEPNAESALEGPSGASEENT